MGPENWTWASAEFLAVSLVMTFVVSRVLLWLTKGLRDGFARILIANGLSLVICGIVYGKLIAGTYDFQYFPDVMSAVTDFFLPQGVWLLLDVILETRQLSRANKPHRERAGELPEIEINYVRRAIEEIERLRAEKAKP